MPLFHSRAFRSRVCAPIFVFSSHSRKLPWEGLHLLLSISSLILFFLIFGLHRAACGILAPWPEIEPAPPALAAQSLNHWTTREFPSVCFLLSHPRAVLFYPFLPPYLATLATCPPLVWVTSFISASAHIFPRYIFCSNTNILTAIHSFPFSFYTFLFDDLIHILGIYYGLGLLLLQSVRPEIPKV